MALLFMDSFDNYVTADVLEKWTSLTVMSGNTNAIVAAVGRHSSSAYRIGSSGSDSGGSGLNLTLTPTDSKIISGFAYNPITPFSSFNTGTNVDGTSVNIAACLFCVRNAGIAQSWIKVNTNGTISLMAVSSGTTSSTLGTSSATLTQSAFNYIEVAITIHNTSGTCEIRNNGVTILGPLSSLNTRGTTSSVNAWNSIRFGFLGIAVSPNTNYIEDLYICDGSGSAPYNTFLGDCRVDPRYPTAEGTTIGWTPLSGTDNALMVDETAPDDDTTYNSAATTGLTDTFVVQDAPVVGATIYGIQHNLSMKKSDAGICTVAPVIRHSGADNAGAALSPGTSYAYGLQIATEIAPGVAITESNFNAAEFGYKRVT